MTFELFRLKLLSWTPLALEKSGREQFDEQQPTSDLQSFYSPQNFELQGSQTLSRLNVEPDYRDYQGSKSQTCSRNTLSDKVSNLHFQREQITPTCSAKLERSTKVKDFLNRSGSFDNSSTCSLNDYKNINIDDDIYDQDSDDSNYSTLKNVQPSSDINEVPTKNSNNSIVTSPRQLNGSNSNTYETTGANQSPENLETVDVYSQGRINNKHQETKALTQVVKTSSGTFDPVIKRSISLYPNQKINDKSDNLTRFGSHFDNLEDKPRFDHTEDFNRRVFSSNGAESLFHRAHYGHVNIKSQTLDRKLGNSNLKSDHLLLNCSDFGTSYSTLSQGRFLQQIEGKNIGNHYNSISKSGSHHQQLNTIPEQPNSSSSGQISKDYQPPNEQQLSLAPNFEINLPNSKSSNFDTIPDNNFVASKTKKSDSAYQLSGQKQEPVLSEFNDNWSSESKPKTPDFESVGVNDRSQTFKSLRALNEQGGFLRTQTDRLRSIFHQNSRKAGHRNFSPKRKPLGQHWLDLNDTTTARAKHLLNPSNSQQGQSSGSSTFYQQQLQQTEQSKSHQILPVYFDSNTNVIQESSTTSTLEKQSSGTRNTDHRDQTKLFSPSGSSESTSHVDQHHQVIIADVRDPFATPVPDINDHHRLSGGGFLFKKNTNNSRIPSSYSAFSALSSGGSGGSGVINSGVHSGGASTNPSVVRQRGFWTQKRLTEVSIIVG